MRMVWLDGRNFAKAEGSDDSDGHSHDMSAEMTLRSALLHPDGRLSGEALLDDRVCDCCQTDAVRTSRGALVAYRDRSPDELRDISLVRLEDGEWSDPYPLHPDNWETLVVPSMAQLWMRQVIALPRRGSLALAVIECGPRSPMMAAGTSASRYVSTKVPPSVAWMWRCSTKRGGAPPPAVVNVTADRTG